MTLEPYEIYALKYACRDASRNDHLIFKDPHDDPAMPMDYFVWAIVGKKNMDATGAGAAAAATGAGMTGAMTA